MGFLNWFKKKKKQEPIEYVQWNKMWDLWAKGEIPSPFAELMEYDSQVNNGGHAQFFDNVSESADLSAVLSALYAILNEVLKNNLQKAERAYLELDEFCDELEQIFDECDDVFYANESGIEKALKEYAKTIEV